MKVSASSESEIACFLSRALGSSPQASKASKCKQTLLEGIYNAHFYLLLPNFSHPISSLLSTLSIALMFSISSLPVWIIKYREPLPGPYC